MEVFRPVEECFEDIPGYDGRYQISSWGRVYNAEKKVFLKPSVHNKGSLRVDLYRDGKRKHHKVHRLVAEAFIPNTDNKPQVMHKDGNKQNNSFTNLEWVTNDENAAHSYEMRRWE